MKKARGQVLELLSGQKASNTLEVLQLKPISQYILNHIVISQFKWQLMIFLLMKTPYLCLFIATLALLSTNTNGALLFQKTDIFGALQLKLTTSSGFVSQSSGTTFSFSNPGYQNLSSMGLALCGYDLPALSTVQFSAQASYDEQSNSFVLIVLPTNGTTFYFLNYFLLICTEAASSYLSIQNICLTPTFELTNPTIYNRTFQYNISGPFTVNSSSTLTGLPYIVSLNSIANPTYNYYNVTTLRFPLTNVVQVIVFLNYSMVSQVCLSILYYYQTVALQANSNLNISFAGYLSINSGVPSLTLASVSQRNFTINSIYGPNFTPKCMVGLSSIKWSSMGRQTLNFNMTGNGIYNIISSSTYQMNYNWICVSQIICSSSSQQYYPIINECEPKCIILNCSVCSTSTSCLTCRQGFYINTLYRCDRCVANCATCTSSTDCQQCFNGFFFNTITRQCVQCPAYCLSCTSGICTSCQYGYLTSGNQCLKCSTLIPQCVQCNSAGFCNICPNGTIFQSVNTGCVNCNSTNIGCLTCVNLQFCSSCQEGFYLFNGRCISCTITVPQCCSFMVPNCVTCLANMTCSVCIQNFLLLNGSCRNCSLLIPNCISCSNQTACQVCLEGFYLKADSSCENCSLAISECQICANMSFCLTCRAPYLAVEGKCYDCPIWPLKEIYYLDSNNKCQPCGLVTSNCYKCSSNVTCTQCKDLYFLLNNSCALCSMSIPNCYSCKDNKSCGICFNGYYPDSSSGICLLCNATIPQCLSCTSLYYNIIDSFILSCQVCEPQYFINNTICSPCNDALPFCLTCLNNYQCNQCQAGYYLSSVLSCVVCQDIIPGCTVCNSSSICSGCQVGYYLLNSYCTLCSMAINNCFDCSTLNSTLTCQTCLPGYYLGVNFTCLMCNLTIQFCAACTSKDQCLTCISGFTRNYNGSCSPCSSIVPYCSYCTPELTCGQCLKNYILSPFGDCLSCNYYIPGCDSCQYTLDNQNISKLNCSQCLSGYLMYNTNNFTSCIACNASIFYCQQCINLTHCQTCSNISFINQNRQCSLCSLYLTGCLYCNSSNTCIGCNYGYYLATNNTCASCDLTQFGIRTALNLSICLSCINNGATPICLLCYEGYYLLNGNCSLCSEAIASCQLCASSTLCIRCQNGYYLSGYNAKCLECDPSLTDCATCLANGTCLQCLSNYYLNTTLNRCIKCSSSTAHCNRCNISIANNITCIGCQDGYYLSGQTCSSCSEAMSGCVLCSNGSDCLVTSSNSSSNTSKIIFIIIAVISLLAILMLVICLVYRYKQAKKEEKQSKKGQMTSSQTQRQLVYDQMDSDSSSEKTVKITQKQQCHFCNKNPFEAINVELLCTICAERRERGNSHKIKIAVGKEGIKKTKREHREMVESIRTEQGADLQPPPPSQIQHPSHVRPLTEQQIIQQQRTLPKQSNIQVESKMDHGKMIEVRKQTQSMVHQPRVSSTKGIKSKGIGIISSKDKFSHH